MHIDIKDRDGNFIYIESIDKLLIGEGKVSHWQILAENGILIYVKPKHHDLRTVIPTCNVYKESAGYILGDTAIIDQERTNCDIEVVKKKLEETGRFKEIKIN